MDTEEGLKDYRSTTNTPRVDNEDIAAHHSERWQNQAMYVGLHFAHNPNRTKRRKHRHRHHHKDRHGDKNADHNEGDSSKPLLGAVVEEDGDRRGETPPSQRVQFLLGQEDCDEDHMSHDIFCEMEELRPVGDDGDVEWKEIARWIKFEEDVEEGGERWSKPHVATLSLHSLFELRKGILSGTVMLDLAASNIQEITELVLDNMVSSKQLEEEHRDKVQEVLLSRHRHQHERANKGLPIIRSLADIGKKHSSKGLDDHKDGGSGHPEKHLGDSLKDGNNKGNLSKRGSSKDFHDENGGLTDTPSTQKFNEHFLKKIPQGAEASNVLVGEVDFLNHPIIAFVRLAKAQMLGDLTEVPVPTRFIFILLGPIGNQSRYHEIGRSIATLMSDEVFHDVAYKAKNRGDLLCGIDEFLDQVTVLPPGEWDPTIRIEPPKSVPSQEGRKAVHPPGGLPNGLAGADTDDHDGADEHGDSLVRTGKIFGGLRADISRKAPFYLSDFKDVLHVQCIASIFFMYFACLTPIITFGGLLGSATDDNMAAMESLLAGAICGISYHMFSGQPLTIIGSTGPVLVFETIVFNFCDSHDLHFLALRFWIGLWVCLILLFIVAFDLSALVRFITRFTEESFACLIALIFIYEAFKKLVHILDHDGVYREFDPAYPPKYECACINTNDSSLILMDKNVTGQWIHEDEDECKKLGGELEGMGCAYRPDVFFFCCLLFLGTFVVAYFLKAFRNKTYFPSRVRGIISDFAVMIAIVSMVGVEALVGLRTPKLNVPEEFKPTRDDRGWVVDPFKNPWWCAFAAIIPALLATILIFMDQQITAVIVNRKENKLRKGCGYHLDLFLIAIQIGICSVLGIPWFVAATVLSINHVRSLTMESESAAPGEKPRFLGIREQRVTGIVVFLMVGISVTLGPFLKVHSPISS